MLYFILLVTSALYGIATGRTGTGLTCQCSGYDVKQFREEDSMSWFNMLADAWYQTNGYYVFKMADEMIDILINTQLPTFIVSLKLTKFGFREGNFPKFTNVKSHVDKIKCHSGVLRRYTIDMDVYYYSKQSIADLSIEVPLGGFAQCSLTKVELTGTVRVELLMSTEAGYPGIMSASVSFLGRPRLAFNVELDNIIGLDTFGVDTWVEGKVEDLLLKELVYPGAYYLDLSKLSTNQKVQNFIVKNDPELHAAVLSAVVSVRPNYMIKSAKKLTAMFHLQDHKTYAHAMSDNATFQFDRFLDSFSSQSIEAKIRLYEDTVFSTKTYAEFTVDVPLLIKSDYLTDNYTVTYQDGKKSWNIIIKFWAYLLPKVPLVQQGKSVITLKTLPGVASCVNGGEKGVLYIHVHRAADLLIMDSHGGSSDPYVVVFLNEVEIGRTATIPKTTYPVFDKKFEVLLRSETKLVSEQKLTFQVYDHDIIARDEKMGRVSILATKNSRINEGWQLEKSTGRGVLYISTTFRPIPFLFV